MPVNVTTTNHNFTLNAIVFPPSGSPTIINPCRTIIISYTWARKQISVYDVWNLNYLNVGFPYSWGFLTCLTQKSGYKIQRLFHDQFTFSMTKNCWKPSILGAYFCSMAKKKCFQFSNSTKYFDQKMTFHDFSWHRPFSLKSMTFPSLKNAFSNSTTFHDRSTLSDQLPTHPSLRFG